jgi:hypothetical protein
MGGEVTISIGLALTVMLGMVLPIVLYFWKVHNMVSDNHKKLNEGLGHKATHTLLNKHMEEEENYHIENLQETKEIKHAIRELSHYSRWLAKHQSGETPPPYVRNGD